jgi:hypothetical protein
MAGDVIDLSGISDAPSLIKKLLAQQNTLTPDDLARATQQPQNAGISAPSLNVPGQALPPPPPADLSQVPPADQGAPSLRSFAYQADNGGQIKPTRAANLMKILQSGLQGALAGQAENAQTYAQTGRNAGFGGGFAGARQDQIQRMMLPWEYAQKQAQLQDTQAQTRQRDLAGQMATVRMPDGTSYTVPQSKVSSIIGAQIGAKGRTDSATIGAKSKLDAIGLQTQIQQGQVSHWQDSVNPDTGQPAVEMFNKFGQSMGFADHSVIPSLMAKTSDTVEYEQDANGVMHILPKRTVTAPQVPGAGRPAIPSSNPIQTGQGRQTASGPPSGDTVTQSPQPQRAPYAQTGPPTGSMPANGATGQPLPTNAPQPARPRAPGVGGIVPGFQGKAASDMGVAYDPQTGNRLWTTRAEAAQNNYQQFAPGGRNAANQMDKDRVLNVRLGDVEQKISAYDQTMTQDLTAGDKWTMARVLSQMDNKAANSPEFLNKIGAGSELSILNELEKAGNLEGLSSPARKRLIAYVNAREAMNGYSRVLAGGGQSNETALHLNLDVLPSPMLGSDYAQEAFDQFRQNLDTVGQGIPRIKGVKAPIEFRDVPKRNQGAQPSNQSDNSKPGLMQRLGNFLAD